MSTQDRAHTSITVSDPDRAAKTLCELFGWRMTSTGSTTEGNRSILVGTGQTWVTLRGAVNVQHGHPVELSLVPTLTPKLNHVGIPARCPETLAAWYGVHFKLMVEGAFAYGDGWLIACEPGSPLTEKPAHFGFMLDNRTEVDRWKEYFREQGVAVDVQRDGNAIFMTDPEGNSFEIFFDPTRFVAPK